MKYIAPNRFRGVVGLLGILAMMAGAWIMWGIGAALFSSGLLLALDATSDQAVERFTGTTRYPRTPEATGHE